MNKSCWIFCFELCSYGMFDERYSWTTK